MKAPGAPRLGHPQWSTAQATDLNQLWQDLARVINTNAAIGTIDAFNHDDLPVASKVGDHAVILDSTVNTWGAIVAGGGSFVVLAWFNGTNWTVIGV